MHAHDLDHVAQPPPSLVALPVAPFQAIATVVEAAPAAGAWVVDDGRQRRTIRRAASCPLEPAVGDRVWVVGEAAGELYAIAVLERARPCEPATLAFPGDVALTAGGRLTLHAEQGVELVTPATTSVSTGELDVTARKGRAAIAELSLFARKVFASLAELTHVGRVLELFVDRVTQRSEHSTRAIAGIDRTSAQTIDYRAERSAHVRAEHALVDGAQLVKLEGGQIHLG